MENLTRLHLENNPITDDGLKVIEGLPHLESLNLYGTKVTANALESLKTLPSLKKVFLWQTNVTAEEAVQLQEALPNVEVDAGISLGS
jgi:Leucine-rich repeat (LRR) protein